MPEIGTVVIVVVTMAALIRWLVTIWFGRWLVKRTGDPASLRYLAVLLRANAPRLLDRSNKDEPSA